MRSSSLYVMIALSGMVFGAEIVSSHVTQSLVLLISAYHMLYNILSLLLLVISHRMSRGKTLTNTFGWARIKVLGQLINMLFLGALCFAVSVEAVQTMVHASHENTEPRYPRLLVGLGIINLILNIICFLLIGGYTHHQGCSMIIQEGDMKMNCILNEPVNGSSNCADNKETSINIPHSSSVPDPGCCWDHQLLDISRDVSSCLAVIACGCIILLMEGLILKYSDAILAIASVVVLLATTYQFVRESGLILLQSIPNHINVEGLTKRLQQEFPDLLNVHDLHVWRLTASEVIATVHVILYNPHVYTRIEKLLTLFFLREGISSVTVQPEFTNGTWPEKTKLECILQCSTNNNCGALTCCGPLIEHSKQSSARHRCSSSHQNEVSKSNSQKAKRNDTSEPKYDFAKIASAVETAV